MAEELLSFAILTYKNFDGIIDTLDSLFSQDYPRIELIISDDGSPNYYEEIENVKEYINCNKTSNIENVIYSHLEINQGTVKNLNNSIEKCNGKYYKLLGGGDVLASTDALSKYVSFLEGNDVRIVFSKLVGITPDGSYVKHLAACEDDYDKLRELSPDELCNKLYARNFLPGPAWCAKRELFDINGMFIEKIRLIEDYPYWINLCRNKEKIGFMDDVLINYKLDGVSSTGTYSKMFMEDMFAIYENYIFPYDKRYSFLQPLYNAIKKSGLNAYMNLAKWKEYTITQKIISIIKYGLLYMYMWVNNKIYKYKNKKIIKGEV